MIEQINPKIVYYGDWQRVDLCIECGEDLGSDVDDNFWMRPCPRCGQIGTFTPNEISTSRRFVCTKRRWFLPDLGYYEWSGKTSGGRDIRNLKIMRGRTIFNSTLIGIAATGVASGLF